MLRSPGMRIAVVLAVALPLAAADLLVKATRETPSWAYHERSLAWLAVCTFVLAGLVVVTRIPSALVPPAVGILAGGVLGNAISAAWNDFAVPNPLVITGDDAIVAFNLADVYVLAGVAVLLAVVGAWLVRNRDALKDPADVRASLVTAFRRRR
jgi:hypothetical protein